MSADAIRAHLRRRDALEPAGNRVLAGVVGRHLRDPLACGADQRSAGRGTVCAVARPHSRTDRRRLAGPGGVLRRRRLHGGDSRQRGLRRSDSGARRGDRPGRAGRLRDRAAAAARRRSDPADGDDGRGADARRTRQQERVGSPAAPTDSTLPSRRCSDAFPSARSARVRATRRCSASPCCFCCSSSRAGSRVRRSGFR